MPRHRVTGPQGLPISMHEGADTSALAARAHATPEREIGIFMKVLARLDPLGGSSHAIVRVSPKAMAETPVLAKAKPRSRSQARATR